MAIGSAQLVPGQPRRLVALVTGELLRPALERLAMAAGWTHRVRQRKDASQALHHARLAAHDGPALGGMVANLEQPAIDRDVVPVDVEHDDVARGDAYDGIPRPSAQRVRARRADAGPALGLQPGRCDHAMIHNGLYLSARLGFWSDRYHSWGGQNPRITPHPHSLNPHTWHLAQPSMNASCEPQSGQAPMKSWLVSRARSPAAPSGPPISSRAGTPAAAPPAPANKSCCTPCFSCIHFSIAMPIASGTDMTLVGPSPTTRSEEMPRSWRWISFIGMPERSANEMSRPIASTSAMIGAPALPREMNTSNGWPFSSSVMVTYIVPSGVSMRRVMPRSRSGRERLARRCRFSASDSWSWERVRSSSASSSAIRPRASASLPGTASVVCCGFLAVEPVESTCPSRAPSRYPVTPLQPSWKASR